MNRVYLLGAGFSRAVSSEMPMMGDLSSSVQKNLNDKRGFTGIPGAGTPIAENFEQWLSYLVESPPWLSQGEQLRNLAAFNDVALAVSEVLLERQTAAVAWGACPAWLESLVKYWAATSATVITFNYDLFVELAGAIHVGGGGDPLDRGFLQLPAIIARAGTVSGSATPNLNFQLLKLHGSLNWRYSGPGSPPGDLIYNMGINASQGWSINGISPRDDETEELLRDREPMIVPPAAVKSSYYNNRTLRSLWVQGAEALRRADELVIMGFSLPVTDLIVGSMLTTTLRSDATIVPVDYSKDVADRVRALFKLDESSEDRLIDTYAGLAEEAIPQWVERFANTS